MKNNPSDVLNIIFIRESHVRYALFTSHLSLIGRNRFMILNICGVCVMLFGHKHNTFSASILTGVGWPGSSVGIATDYGLDGPGSNPGGDEIFRPSRPALGPTQPPVTWVPSLSRV